LANWSKHAGPKPFAEPSGHVFTFLHSILIDFQGHILRTAGAALRNLRVSSLNNPQNSEMKFCENMTSGDMLKIIIIIIGYDLNNFTTHITILW
jgi:hypothetical protein